MRNRALILSVVLAVGSMACGQGTGSSGGPVEPPVPTNTAAIVATGNVTFGLCTGPGAGCFYSQRYGNSGSGCANNLRGKIRAYEDEALLETDDWWLESSIVIDPNEVIPVEDCCFDQDTVRRRTRVVTETFWNNVPCS